VDIVPYINQLYWVNAVVLYLNAYVGVSQTKISQMLGISQFGVSKRYQASKNKLKFVMTKPIKDRSRLKQILSTILPTKYCSPLIVFYSFNLMSITYRVMGNVGTVKINNNFKLAVSLLKEYSECETEHQFKNIMEREGLKTKDLDNWKIYHTSSKKLYTFFNDTRQMCLYGNYLFKANDDKNRADFDKHCTFGFDDD
jgi:hypothetical protein